MKTKWIIPIIALALGCNRETDTNTAFIDGAFSLYASSEENDTRTVLQHDGRVFWSPADYINVFYGDRAGKFKSTNTESAASSEFVGSLGTFILDGETEFVAIYPYADDNSISGGTLNLSLPSEQTAVEGTFADDLFICVAKSKDYNLHFFNVCGGVKFSLARGDIKKIVFRSNHGESLAGNMAVDFSSDGIPQVSSIKNGSSMVSLVAPDNGTFTADSFYYLVLAPQVLEGGYTLELYTDELVKTISSNSPITIRRSAWGVLRHLADETLDEYEAIDLATPLCLEAIEDGTITVDNPLGLVIEYKKGPAEWIETGSSLIKIAVSAGDKVYFRGDNSTYSDNDDNDTHFSCSGKAYIYGNIMSLCHSLNFENCFSLSASHAFARLFLENTNLRNHPERPLVMPALTLTESCYESMFAGCTGLTSAPVLPATTMARSCYSGMFRDCEGLTSAPELPATTLAYRCYYGMFECCGLTTAPELPATTLEAGCYWSMFRGCGGLTTAPELPATTLAEWCYWSMFWGCRGLTTAPELPATTLAARCYMNMFLGCEDLTTAPDLPAITLAEDCYSRMFSGCKSLTTAPELPATTLAEWCYNSMFWGCEGLTTAPELPAITLADDCYSGMFSGCKSLTTAPELPATTMARSCYSGMFRDCEGLTTAPELPAITLADDCYSDMFSGCKSLTTAPELPATTLAEWCYNSMFWGCEGLTTAPDLLATTLVERCYSGMFGDCSNLNYIKMLATDVSAGDAMTDWVSGVAAAGTFVKDFDATWDVVGENGVPQGWTVETVFTRDQIHVTGVSLNKSSLTLIKGDSEKLTATIAPANADIQDLIWSSSDASVASVDQNGNVHALKNGFADIEVKSVDGDRSAICRVTVRVPVTSVSLNKTSLSFAILGGTEKLEPTVNPSDASDKTVTWSSSDPSVATVGSDGTVTAHGSGTAEITVTTNDGGKTARCMVYVVIPVTSVTLDKSTVTLTKGSTITLHPSVTPSYATNNAVTWSSLDATIATVDPYGVVTGITGGSTQVTVTTVDGGKTATCEVIVTVPVISVSLNKSELTLTVGQSATLLPTLNPTDATTQSVTWSSSKESVATVSAEGNVTAVSVGTAVITVKTVDGNKTATCTITVNPQESDREGYGNADWWTTY